MRKILSFILIVSLAFMIAGCSIHCPTESTSNTEITNTTVAIETITTTTSPVVDSFDQKPMIAVSLPVIEQTHYAEDGTLLFRYSYRDISLIVPDPEVADKVIVDFLNRIDQVETQAQGILEAAKSAYPVSAQWTPYLCQIDYDPARIDSGVLSLMGSYATYSGTPHPEKNYHSVNYNLVTGDILTLQDILTADSSADTLYPLIIAALNLQKDDKHLYQGFEDTVMAQSDLNATWYFSQSGLCFYFSPYEIAPYASGVITAEIPYSQLIGILNDAYFPAEIEYSNSKLHVEPFNDMDLDKFTQFSEVILDESGNKILIYTDGSVNHIQIQTGSWNADGTEFSAEHTVFAAYRLTPGDATMVESEIPDGLPNMRISYDTAAGTISNYIAYNNNQPVLTEEP